MGRAGLVTLGLVGASQLDLTAQTVIDFDILNFALNLEYLEAEYYLRAAYGRGLDPADVTGTGTPGSVIVKSESTLVPFQTAAIQGYAQEIALDDARTCDPSVPR